MASFGRRPCRMFCIAALGVTGPASAAFRAVCRDDLGPGLPLPDTAGVKLRCG
jgi:hypothetical protein